MDEQSSPYVGDHAILDHPGQSKIYAKGQITIPKAARDAAGLAIGDRVVVEARDGEVVVRRPRGVLEFEPPAVDRQSLPGPMRGGRHVWNAAPSATPVIVDTNVLLRLLERDPGPHGRAARGRVEDARAGQPIAVLAATVLEVGFVLESAAAGCGWDRGDVAAAILAIVDEQGFVVEHREAVRGAAATYRDGAPTYMIVCSVRSPASAV